MSSTVAKVISSVALVWLSIGVCHAAGASPAAGQPEQILQAHVLITSSHAAIEKWVLMPPGERGGDRGRLRIVSKGEKVYFPVVVTGYKLSGTGPTNVNVVLEFVPPSGKGFTIRSSGALAPKDNRTPGLLVLNPVAEVVFEPNDPAGTYTARARVTGDAGTATASESFRVQAGTGKEKVAASMGEAKPAPSSGVKQRSRANEDARACLELSTNEAIMGCAEKYR